MEQGIPRWQVHKRVTGESQRRGCPLESIESSIRQYMTFAVPDRKQELNSLTKPLLFCTSNIPLMCKQLPQKHLQIRQASKT